MDERKSLLKYKLAANHQRLLREEYLARLPERLGTYLDTRPYVQSPELDAIVSMFYISPKGCAHRAAGETTNTHFKPEGYLYREFSWTERLFEAVLAIGEQHDKEMALLYPFAGPLYEVPFGWVRKNIVELFTCEWRTQDFGKRQEYCPERVGVITLNREAGLVLDNYSGYLEEDPNPDETVYELAVWGFSY